MNDPLETLRALSAPQAPLDLTFPARSSRFWQTAAETTGGIALGLLVAATVVIR